LLRCPDAGAALRGFSSLELAAKNEKHADRTETQISHPASPSLMYKA
jgi:hypothetical protein